MVLFSPAVFIIYKNSNKHYNLLKRHSHYVIEKCSIAECYLYICMARKLFEDWRFHWSTTELNHRVGMRMAQAKQFKSSIRITRCQWTLRLTANFQICSCLFTQCRVHVMDHKTNFFWIVFKVKEISIRFFTKNVHFKCYWNFKFILPKKMWWPIIILYCNIICKLYLDDVNIVFCCWAKFRLSNNCLIFMIRFWEREKQIFKFISSYFALVITHL